MNIFFICIACVCNNVLKLYVTYFPHHAHINCIYALGIESSNSKISIFRTRICRILAKYCLNRIVNLNQKCFLEYNYGCGDSFYKSELPKVQINLHFG